MAPKPKTPAVAPPAVNKPTGLPDTMGMLPTDAATKLANAIKGPFTHEGKTGSSIVSGHLIHTQTQKARGIFTLGTLSQSTHYAVPATAVVSGTDNLSDSWATLQYNTGIKPPFFVRPCPITPMHGFVDSKLCANVSEAQAILDAALKADPKAELLICEPIDALWNAIVTPTMIILGPGHDGATSGSLTLTIPMTGTVTNRWAEWSHAAGVAQGDVPYLELVADKRWWLTQLRGGPQVTFQVDYIPASLVVEHVVEAKGDLLEWADAVSKFAPNTAVWHPNGSLGTHYGVHCITHGIPILTSAAPVVGQVLEPLPLAPLDIDAIRTGIVVGTLIPLASDTAALMRASAIELVLLALHQSAALRGEHAFWLGVACSLMHRLGIAAALGEWRHAGENKLPGPYHGWNRGKVYSQVLGPVFDYRKQLPDAFASFLYGAWNGGFGGKKWAACSQAIVRLDETMHQVFESRDEAVVANLITALNVSVNQAHNNGWWMNKFIPASAFNFAAAGDLITALHALPAIVEAVKVVYGERDMVETTLYRWLMASPLGSTARGKALDALKEPLLPSAQVAKTPGSKLKKPPASYPSDVVPVIPPAPLEVCAAACHADSGSGKSLHIQLVFKGYETLMSVASGGKAYCSFDPEVPLAHGVLSLLAKLDLKTPSMSGSGVSYHQIILKPAWPDLPMPSLSGVVGYQLYAGNDQPVLVGGEPVMVNVPCSWQATVHGYKLAMAQNADETLLSVAALANPDPSADDTDDGSLDTSDDDPPSDDWSDDNEEEED